MENINKIIKKGAGLSQMEITQIIEIELSEWLRSDKRKQMLQGEQYYRNITDIQDKTVKSATKSNIKLEHGFLKKLVDQKIGYLLSKTPTITPKGDDNDDYEEKLQEVFNDYFLRTLKNTGKDAINKGIGWIQIYINESGELCFKQIPSEETIPLWTDSTHSELNAIIRVYETFIYTKTGKEKVKKIEFWDNKGVKYYVQNPVTANSVGFSNGLVPDVTNGIEASHFSMISGENEQGYNWNRPPFIAIKYNTEELPLLSSIKSLIDNYNKQASVNADTLADLPLLTYILKNYGGEDAEEFIKKIRDNGVVLIGDGGELKTLAGTVNTQALEELLSRDRHAIIEFGRGVDTQSENLGSASGVALKFRFADLDMDMNVFESELNASFKDILYFVNSYLSIIDNMDYSDLDVHIVFNRDIIISKADAIRACKDSIGVTSEKTVLENHPFVDDAKAEIEQKRLEREDELKEQMEKLKQLGNFDHEEIEE